MGGNWCRQAATVSRRNSFANFVGKQRRVTVPDTVPTASEWLPALLCNPTNNLWEQFTILLWKNSGIHATMKVAMTMQSRRFAPVPKEEYE